MAMSTTLKEKKEQLALIEQQIDEVRVAAFKYNTLCTQRHKLSEEINKAEKATRHSSLVFQCRYEEPDYPGIGILGNNGSAYFKDEATAKALIESLSATYGWSKRFYLEYTGPGAYKVVPEAEYDRDGDLVYSAGFMKDVEE